MTGSETRHDGDTLDDGLDRPDQRGNACGEIQFAAHKLAESGWHGERCCPCGVGRRSS